MAKLTETEWLAARSPGVLLRHLTGVRRAHRSNQGKRRVLLFGVEVCRRVLPLIEHPLAASVVRALDALAEGKMTVEQARTARNEMWAADIITSFAGFQEQALTPEYCEQFLTSEWGNDDAAALGTAGRSREERRRVHLAGEAIDCLACGLIFGRDLRCINGYPHAALALGGVDAPVELARQCDLLRDIFGNPFRPVAFDAAWRTSTATALARQMYESRDFGAMPILADALEDAGCDNDDVLNHCRDPHATHVRGCWVVDLVLGKV